jgi:hypothetical protein
LPRAVTLPYPAILVPYVAGLLSLSISLIGAVKTKSPLHCHIAITP